MAWAAGLNVYVPAASGATWDARAVADIRRPALFVFLDWPSGVVRASTFHKSVTIDGDAWTGVGNLAFLETSAFQRSSALVTYKLGLTSLPQDAITEETEAAAIGRRAILYEGLFDDAWSDPVLKRIFIGHVISAGDFKHRRQENGDWLTDASIEISNGRSPRRMLENHHSPQTAVGNDTAWRHLPGVGRRFLWPGEE